MCYQTAQRHERNLKFLSEGSQFVKATSVWSNLVTFWKRQNYGDSTKK